MKSYTLPLGKQVSGMIGTLVGKQLGIEDCPPFYPLGEEPTVIAVYRDNDGDVAAIAAFEVKLAAYCAAALLMLPKIVADECVTKGELDENLLDCFGEVANVLARLFTDVDSIHVKLNEVLHSTGELTYDHKKLICRPGRYLSQKIDVEGYGAGRLSLLVPN